MKNSLDSLLSGFPDREFVQLVFEMLHDNTSATPSEEILLRLIQIRNKKDTFLQSKINKLPQFLLKKLEELEDGSPSKGHLRLVGEQGESPGLNILLLSELPEESLFVLIYRLQRKDVPVFTKINELGEKYLADAYRNWLNETSPSARRSLIGDSMKEQGAK